jgi:PiT family inorganic phosphate transporter
MTVFAFLLLATCFLAYSNGANDNFKGVATLFGSGTTDYRRAIRWATITTFAGSLCSIFLAEALRRAFTGKGLVPDAVAMAPEFMLAVGLGAALTVMLATVTGFPISTTHALTGGLFGAGLVAVGRDLNFSALGGKFFLPLLISPFLALLVTGGLYAVLRRIRLHLGITEEWCVCVGEEESLVPITISADGPGAPMMTRLSGPTITLDTGETCVRRYSGSVLGVSAQTVLDSAHFLSAGVVSFARGLNDTPKIVALLVAAQALGLRWGMAGVAVAMAVGGLLSARRVAQTMSKKITPLNHGQGFTANLVTGVLVIGASLLGRPVSTTHVSVGAIFGIGAATREANARVVSEILMAWLLTLPIAAGLAATTLWLLS